ncbi:MAG: SprB repeat-containing protein, partial [Bacteroidia bacterium]|nr:SprB repeat-containing protein [Bacteroidia bacterium]
EGGTLPYSYNWAVNADTLYNLCAGPISVTVTDANGCTVSHAFIILEPTEISATTTANTAHCNQDDGNATVYPTGGTVSLNYDYLWDDPQHQTTQTASNLSSGIYFVTVADDNGCTFDTLVDVGNADGVVAIITAQTNVSCFGGNDGNATVTITGGTPNYFYQWSNGTTIATTNTSHSIYNLEADLYTVSVTDAYGCLDATYFEITQPPLLVATLTGVNVSCFGGSDGSTNLTVTGGTQPYTYLWNSGETTEDLTNIPTGNYVVTVTDEHLCSLFKSIIITQPAAPLSSSIITADVSCFGGSDGAINLSVAGGTPSYHYLWTNGDITQDINGIPIGTYFVTITDNNNCTLVNSATINQPDVLLYTTSYTDASCFGETDGTASIIASGGTLPYSYLWSNNIAGQNNSYLAAGTYFVTVTDAQGCTICHGCIQL